MTRYSYDGFGRLRKVTDALNGESAYSYDALGNLLTVTDPQSNTTMYDYWNTGRLAGITRPLLQETLYSTYNNKGNLLQMVTAGGQAIDYGYVNGEYLSSIRYTGRSITIVPDEEGNPVSVSDSDTGGSLYSAQYDGAGRLSGLAHVPLGVTVSYSYDNGTLTGCTVSGDDPFTINYADFDGRNRPRELLILTKTIELDYSVSGRVTGLALPNGITADYSYTNGRLSSIVHDDVLGGRRGRRGVTSSYVKKKNKHSVNNDI